MQPQKSFAFFAQQVYQQSQVSTLLPLFDEVCTRLRPHSDVADLSDEAFREFAIKRLSEVSRILINSHSLTGDRGLADVLCGILPERVYFDLAPSLAMEWRRYNSVYDFDDPDYVTDGAPKDSFTDPDEYSRALKRISFSINHIGTPCVINYPARWYDVKRTIVSTDSIVLYNLFELKDLFPIVASAYSERNPESRMDDFERFSVYWMWVIKSMVHSISWAAGMQGKYLLHVHGEVTDIKEYRLKLFKLERAVAIIRNYLIEENYIRQMVEPSRWLITDAVISRFAVGSITAL